MVRLFSKVSYFICFSINTSLVCLILKVRACPSGNQLFVTSLITFSGSTLGQVLIPLHGRLVYFPLFQTCEQNISFQLEGENEPVSERL